MSVDVDRHPVNFRISSEVRDLITDRARELGMSRSAYVRAQILKDLGLPMEAAYSRRVAGDDR